MFDSQIREIELSEPEVLSGGSEDQQAYLVTVDELAAGWIPEDQHHLPGNLEEIPVGPYLALIVSSVDRTKLNGYDLVRVMRIEARLAASHEAGKFAAMVEVAMTPPGDATAPVERSFEEFDYAADEIAAALTLTRRAAETQLDEAISLTGRLGRVWQRLAKGEIDLAKTKDLVNALGHLDRETADTVLNRCLDDAPDLTRGQLRARVARLVMEIDPDGAKCAMEQGLHDRRITAQANPDHTATLTISSVNPVATASAYRHVDRLAHWYKDQGDPRTLDQLHADIAMDLIAGKCGCGNTTTRSGGRAQITVDLQTLARLANHPGELDGFGPVIAEIARKTVRENQDGEWIFQVTDNGKAVATGTLARRPTRAQRRYLHALYPTCVFPGCRMPAHQCDLDHREPHARGGRTRNDNLEPLCRHHHMLRHHSPWLLTRNPDDTHTWTSPHGHTYLVKRGPPD